jgi:hypothetical protein
MAGLQARDRHLPVRICEIGNQHEHAHVHDARLDVEAAALVRGDPIVAKEPPLEARLGPLQAAHERAQTHRTVIVRERDRPVRLLAVPGQRERDAPFVLAA